MLVWLQGHDIRDFQLPPKTHTSSHPLTVVEVPRASVTSCVEHVPQTHPAASYGRRSGSGGGGGAQLPLVFPGSPSRSSRTLGGNTQKDSGIASSCVPEYLLWTLTWGNKQTNKTPKLNFFESPNLCSFSLVFSNLYNPDCHFAGTFSVLGGLLLSKAL